MSKFLLGQIGSPRDYNVAKFLYNENLLQQLVVDTYFSKDSLMAKMPVFGERLAVKLRKYDIGFPLEKVSYDWLGALTMRALQKYSTNINAYTFANKRLNKRLIKYAANKPPGKYYGFDTSSMEFLCWGKDKGWTGYLEQCVAPRSSQIAMWQLFSEKYGIYSKDEIEQCLVQQERERKEWVYASKIIVPSDYVKAELLKDGSVEADKIHVVNYGYTPTADKDTIRDAIQKKVSDPSKTINIFFAGNGGYRKGITDMLTLAAGLKGENITFYIAGKLEPEAKKLLADYKYANVIYLGKLSKEVLNDQYLAADMFFFPSYLEGSAMVLQEAMGWGFAHNNHLSKRKCG